MNRTEFINLCRNCSTLKSGIFHTKENVPEEWLVKYEGRTYYPQAYELRFDDKGGVEHIAVLHDVDANSVTRGYLEKVERLK